MENLTKEQEDIMLEYARERARETQEGENDTHFSSWLSDNIEDLRQEFIENNQNEFDNYCKSEFEIYLEELRLKF